jgi:hypothetical protein
VNVLRLRRPSLELIFVLTESIAWFIVIAVMATLVERAFLEGVAERIQGGLNAHQFANVPQAQGVLADLQAAAGRDAGPSIWVVVAAAGGGFLLMRLNQRLDFGPAVGSIVLVAATLVGVNLLLHVAMGNFRFWDASPLVDLINQPESQTPTGIDIHAFVANPDIRGPHGAALAVTFLGLLFTWFRFMIAGRATVDLDRMTRSFTVAFIVMLATLFIARLAEVDAASRWAVPQFALGMLGLAVGNHERAVPASEAEARTTPWMTSVGGTISLLLLAAGGIAMLAYLEFGQLLAAIGEVLLAIVEFVLVIIITPIYWIMERLFLLLLGGRDIAENLPRFPQLISPEEAGVDPDEEGMVIPTWIWDSLKFFAGVFVLYVMYRVGRLLVGGRGRGGGAVEETRATSRGGAGVGRLLADLVTFRRRRDPDRWLGRHEVYRLFGRAVDVAHERGLRILPTETPEEFGTAARRHLGADPVLDAALMFERARYGRHFAPADEVRRASAVLAEWDQANPPTEEMRERVRGLRPLDEGEEVAFRIAMAKRGLRPEDEAIMRGE